MTDRPSPLALIVVTLWAEARLWPAAARARLPEVRALAQHHGLPCPAREHDVLEPCSVTLRRLLEAAAHGGELRGLGDLAWLLELLNCDLALAARGAL